MKQGFYNWKITEWYLLFIVFFVQDPIFTRETIGWLWRVIVTSNFLKTFILDRQWCKGFYKRKITKWYLLFIVFFVQDPIFTRETTGRLWRHRHVKLLQNIYFGQAVKQGFYNWKITEWYLLFIVFSVQDPIFTRETIGWLWRVIFTSYLFQKIYFGQVVMQGILLSGKLSSDSCCLSFVSSRILFFTRETIDRLRHHRLVKLFKNFYFGQAVMQGVL